MITRKLPDDWFNCYNTRPVLMETFVESEKFNGTSELQTGLTLAKQKVMVN